MNLIKKHWPLLGFILALLIDDQTGLLASLFHDQVVQNIVKGIGAILLAYFWNPAFKNEIKKDINANTDPLRPETPKKRF